MVAGKARATRNAVKFHLCVYPSQPKRVDCLRDAFVIFVHRIQCESPRAPTEAGLAFCCRFMMRANDPRRLVGYLNSRQRSYLLVWAGVAGGKLSFIRITEYRSSNSPPLENSYKCHQSTQKMLFFFPSVASTPTASWLLSQIFVQASKQASCTTSRSLRKSF